MSPQDQMVLVMCAMIFACGVVGYALGRSHQHRCEQRIKWQSQMRRPTRI